MWKYICMIIKLFFPIISCWFKCRKYSKHKERYSLEERYIMFVVLLLNLTKY